jgi:acyl-CoA synthetase (AMP-forming)/AMP-acid ligase II
MSRTIIGDLPRINALRMPSGEAYVDGDRSFTWSEYDERVNRVANMFRDGLGLQPGDRIALLANNCIEYLDLAFSASRIKAIATALNVRHTVGEMLQQLDDAEPSVLLVDTAHAEVGRALADDLRIPLICIDGELEGTFSYTGLLASARGTPIEPHEDDDAVYTLCYTSGTTGEAKGAMVSSRNELAYQASLAWLAQSAPSDRHLVTLPLFHRGGQFATMHPARLGLPVVLLPTPDPDLMMRTIQEQSISVTMMVPTVLKAVCDLYESAPEKYDLSSLRLILYGSNPIPEDLLRRVLRVFDFDVCQIGGMGTEGGVALALTSEEHKDALREPAKQERLRSCGKVQPLAEMRLVDDDDEDVPVGSPGEMVFRSDAFVSGYWRRPEASRKAWRGGWFHSGDIGRMDEDGYVYYVDRMAGRIKTGGETVYAREVEAVIRLSTDVADVCVIGLPDEQWGEAVCAVVQVREGRTLTEGGVRSAVRARLAGYKVPKRVLFVDELPRTALGKIAYGVVREDAGRRFSGAAER